MKHPNYWIRNHIIQVSMMVPYHIQWWRLLRVDIYLQRSTLLKITQMALKELEDFLNPTRYILKKDAKPVIHPQQKWPIAM